MNDQLEQVQKNSRLVNFILRSTKFDHVGKVGFPLLEMGDAWNLTKGLGFFIERIIFYDKSNALSFCSIQWSGVNGKTEFRESKGETCEEALCRCVIKALGGDDIEILGEIKA